MPKTQDQFGPVALAHIAHGALAKKLDDRLAAATTQLAAYVEEGGRDLTKKAKATITLKIDLVHVEAGIFTVRGDVTDKAPATPLPATDRLILEDGQLLMNLADEINEKDDPRQLTIDRENRKKEL